MARSVRDVRTMLVVAAYLVGFVLHAGAIWLLPLYLAQALVAMSLPVTALASHRVEDRLHRGRLGGGRRGDRRAGAALARRRRARATS